MSLLALALLGCSTSPPALPAPEVDLEAVPRLVGLAAKSDADACAAVAHVLTVVPKLDAQLDARKEAGEDLTPSIAALSASLPGIRIADGAETVHVGADWPELARAVGPGKTANALVSLGAFVSTHPVWARPLSDVTACADHAAVRPWLDRLDPSLDRAPACLRETVAPALVASLGAMVDHTCFCAATDAARADVAYNARRLRKLSLSASTDSPLVDGEALASRLEASLAAPHAGFDATCGG